MSKLTEKLREFKFSFNKSVSAEILETLSRSISLIKKQQVRENSLTVGDVVQSGKLYGSNGKIFELNDLLSQAPLIITFARGAWCPYCMLELQEWNKFIKSIDNEINIVAVSAERADLLEVAKADNQLDFPFLEDKFYHLARKFGLTYEVDAQMKEVLLKWGIDLAIRTCIDDFILPIPATYIVNKNNEICYAFLEEDYTERAEPQDVYNKYKTLL
ncbi:MAG: redoxin domain-containing protein [Colwellia sp.]|nr:redoxin domain-containing protein [Colwellia sp.]